MLEEVSHTHHPVQGIENEVLHTDLPDLGPWRADQCAKPRSGFVDHPRQCAKPLPRLPKPHGTAPYWVGGGPAPPRRRQPPPPPRRLARLHPRMRRAELALRIRGCRRGCDGWVGVGSAGVLADWTDRGAVRVASRVNGVPQARSRVHGLSRSPRIAEIHLRAVRGSGNSTGPDLGATKPHEQHWAGSREPTGPAEQH
jgi:hypothetical protein